MHQRRERLLSSSMRAGVSAWLALALVAAAPRAHADGAFPDELQVFAPLDQPQRIVLSTNYGLILSDDDGASWSYICEGAISSSLVSMYGIGPQWLYALTNQTVYTSADRGCDWSPINLASTGISSAVDLFADPTRDGHAFAITYTSGQQGFDLYDIDDGGLRDVFPSGASLLRGVEVARADPRVVYAVRFRFDTSAIELLYSDDHGQTFTAIEHPDLGSYYPGIAAVDPMDPATIYLRLSPIFDTGDEIAVSHDSGQTFTVLLTAPGALSAFAVDETHAFYVGDKANDFWYGAADGGITEGSGPSVRCLAARAGVVYACGCTSTNDGCTSPDPFVLGESTDHGAHFSPLVTATTYQTASCAPVRAVCPLIDGGPMPPSDAGPAEDAGSRPGDAGARGAADAGLGGPADAGAADGGNAATAPGSGCGCSSSGVDAGFFLGLVALVFAARRRRPA